MSGNRYTELYRKLKFNITYTRKMQGMTQMELADRIGISRTHMSNIEAPNGKSGMSLEVLFDIADALGTTLEALFSFRD